MVEELARNFIRLFLACYWLIAVEPREPLSDFRSNSTCLKSLFCNSLLSVSSSRIYSVAYVLFCFEWVDVVSILLFHSGLQSFDVICFTTETGDITKFYLLLLFAMLLRVFLAAWKWCWRNYIWLVVWYRQTACYSSNMPAKKYVDCKKRSVAAVMTAALVTGYPENSLLEMRMKKNLKDTAADFCEEIVSLFISLAILQLDGALWYHAMSTFNCLSLGQHEV